MASAKQAFASRLVDAIRARGHISARNAKSGIDVAPLAKAAGVSREMARRYTEGTAMPDANRLKTIADWLGVKVSWLRDGEGDILQQQLVAQEPTSANAWGLSAEAIEIARVFMKMPPERQRCFRDLMCLEAVVATHYPWLTFGRPKSESYNEYERRVERDIMRIAAKLQMKP